MYYIFRHGTLHENATTRDKLEEKCRTHGNKMIQVAKSIIMNDPELPTLFETCVSKAGRGEGLERHCLSNIRVELTNKVVHARVNEFFKARK